MNPRLNANGERLAVLDGWRALSILLVLAAHLLPLGPKSWQLNSAAGTMGMALFFTLSGFLITRFLLRHDSVADFLIRRIFRIIPLAWTALLVTLTLVGASAGDWWRNMLFVANLPPQQLVEPASHFWSLCVEGQFYAGIACLFAAFGARGLLILPLVCLAVTANRVLHGATIDIVTWLRVDEILVGCTLALVVAGRFGDQPMAWIKKSRSWALVLLTLLALCSHPSAGWMNYFRPYAAMLLVGSSLIGAWRPITQLLEARSMAYVAKVSFAIYVIHHLLLYTWLGLADDKVIKYAKRPLLLIATFAVAHLSTYYFERRWIELGRRISARWLKWRAPASSRYGQ